MDAGVTRTLQRLLERPIGPWSGRVWGLILNLAGNAIALWGVASVMRTGAGWTWIVIGGVGTAVCISALALPALESEVEQEGDE
ncbi:MAG: hypothetical protein OXE96_02110 [Gemmatimonadetes bacterium]|nr:hypothetical protein [Gemmatimonadota bacterium]